MTPPARWLLQSLLLSTILASAAMAAPAQVPPSVAAQSAQVLVAPDNPALFYSGRLARDGAKAVTMGWSGSRVCLAFKGKSLALRMTSDTPDNSVVIWLDGKRGEKIRLDSPRGVYPLASDLAPGMHTVEVMRATEGVLGLTHFQGFLLDATGRAHAWPKRPDRRILFVGDSITCGYGVEASDPNLPFEPSTENFCDSYTGLTVRALGADYLVVARSGIGMVRNYGGPFEGSPDAMPSVYPHLFYKVDQPRWDPAQYDPNVICINLGTNDFSEGGVDREKFVARYIAFAGGLLKEYPQARLVLLQGPMNDSDLLHAVLGQVQTSLEKAFPGRVSYFQLTAQGKLGYGASYHPNRAQSELNAGELTHYLAKLMGW